MKNYILGGVFGSISYIIFMVILKGIYPELTILWAILFILLWVIMIPILNKLKL